jgi:hypothetical protein
MFKQIKNYFFLFLHIILFTQSYNIYLTDSQWLSIRKILYFINNEKEVKKEHQIMKLKINKIIYNKYENLAYRKAYHFKKFHSYKCKHIPLLELSLYSRSGLYKAIQHYNPEYNFTSILHIYIRSELLKGLTELYPICRLSKSERRCRKNFLYKESGMDKDNNNVDSNVDNNVDSNVDNNVDSNVDSNVDNNVDNKAELERKRRNYVKSLQTEFVGTNDWLIDNNAKQEKTTLSKIIEENHYREIWGKIILLKPIQSHIFQLKYDFYFTPLRTNLEVSKLLDYSEEYIRINNKKGLNNLLHLLDLQ